MARFDYTHFQDHDDAACVVVDDIFDIHILRTEEGLVIDLCVEEQP